MWGGRKLRARKIKNVIQAMRFALRTSIGHIQENNTTETTNEEIKMKENSRLRSLGLCCMRRLFALLAAYLLGYFDCSIAWLLLITFVIVVLKDHTVQKKIRTISFRNNDIKMILDEKADWLNQALTQMWPHVLNHMSTKMREEVESNICAIFQKYKFGGNFHFKRVHIGPSPLRVNFIEVLQESQPGEMVICADIVYESNCDVTFVWRGIKGGMKDFQMRGRAHLVLRPLINTIPFVSGYHIIFPEKPDVQYKLSGVGLFLDIPGLREIVNHIITKRVSNLMSDSSSSEPDSGTDYQRLIETLKEQDGKFKEEKYDNESSVSDQITSNQKEDSVEKSQESSRHNEAEKMGIKYEKLDEEPVQDNLSPKIPSTPTSEQDIFVRRGHGHTLSVSSTAASECSSVRSDYNPIPKPSRRLLSTSN